MNPIYGRIVGLATGLLLAVALPARGSGVLSRLLPKHEVEVIVVTDTTPAGRALAPITRWPDR